MRAYDIDDDLSEIDHKQGHGHEDSHQDQPDPPLHQQDEFDIKEHKDYLASQPDDDTKESKDLIKTAGLSDTRIWRDAYLKDAATAELIDYAEGRQVSKGASVMKRLMRKVRWENGYLYRTIGEGEHHEDDWRIEVPLPLRHDLIALTHRATWGAHFGTEKIIEVLSRTYYWRKMRQNVSEHVEGCVECFAAKKRPPPNAGLMVVHELVTDPFKIVHFDHVGPLSPSANDNKYILTIIDRGTGWLELVPVPDQSAKRTAKTLWEHWICRYGCPTRFITDRHPSFTSTLMQELHKRFGIAIARTVAYRPQANGLAERVHRTLNATLRTYLSGETIQWEDLIQPFAYAYRNTPRKGWSYSPAQLVFGRRLTFPLDLLSMQDDRHDLAEPDDYVSYLLTNILTARAIVRDKLMDTREKQADYANQTRYHVEFKVGDIVMLYSPKLAKGMIRRFTTFWKGPYRVMRQTGAYNYLIQAGKDKPTTANVTHLLRYDPYYIIPKQAYSKLQLSLDQPDSSATHALRRPRIQERDLPLPPDAELPLADTQPTDSIQQTQHPATSTTHSTSLSTHLPRARPADVSQPSTKPTLSTSSDNLPHAPRADALATSEEGTQLSLPVLSSASPSLLPSLLARTRPASRRKSRDERERQDDPLHGPSAKTAPGQDKRTDKKKKEEKKKTNKKRKRTQTEEEEEEEDTLEKRHAYKIAPPAKEGQIPQEDELIMEPEGEIQQRPEKEEKLQEEQYIIFNDGKHYWLGQIMDIEKDGITIWYYRATKENRPYNSIYRPVWLEKNGKEEWRRVPKKTTSERCEGVIHRKRIVSKPFELEGDGKIPMEIYQQIQDETGEIVI